MDQLIIMHQRTSSFTRTILAFVIMPSRLIELIVFILFPPTLISWVYPFFLIITIISVLSFPLSSIVFSLLPSRIYSFILLFVRAIFNLSLPLQVPLRTISILLLSLSPLYFCLAPIISLFILLAIWASILG